MDKIDYYVLKKYGVRDYIAFKEGRLSINDRKLNKLYGEKEIFNIPVGRSENMWKKIKKLFN